MFPYIKPVSALLYLSVGLISLSGCSSLNPPQPPQLDSSVRKPLNQHLLADPTANKKFSLMTITVAQALERFVPTDFRVFAEANVDLKTPIKYDNSRPWTESLGLSLSDAGIEMSADIEKKVMSLKARPTTLSQVLTRHVPSDFKVYSDGDVNLQSIVQYDHTRPWLESLGDTLRELKIDIVANLDKKVILLKPFPAPEEEAKPIAKAAAAAKPVVPAITPVKPIAQVTEVTPAKETANGFYMEQGKLVSPTAAKPRTAPAKAPAKNLAQSKPAAPAKAPAAPAKAPVAAPVTQVKHTATPAKQAPAPSADMLKAKAPLAAPAAPAKAPVAASASAVKDAAPAPQSKAPAPSGKPVAGLPPEYSFKNLVNQPSSETSPKEEPKQPVKK